MKQYSNDMIKIKKNKQIKGRLGENSFVNRNIDRCNIK